MHGGYYCVAGWRHEELCMVRPLPNGTNWTLDLLNKSGIVPGSEIDVTSNGQPSTGIFPHRTEDMNIDPMKTKFIGICNDSWFAKNAPSAAATLNSAFQGHLQNNGQWNGIRNGNYVADGVHTRSLWAVKIHRDDIEFIDESYKDEPKKLKAIVTDSESRYKLAVSCKTLKEAWVAGGLAALRKSLPARDCFHIRLGLARAFGNPADKCYLMINGVNG